jgi:uncharacterized protein (TIGR04255 family)
MAERRHLSKAPIREAVLDIRIPVREDLEVEALHERLLALGDFSQVHEMRRGSAVFMLSAQGEPSSRIEDGAVMGFNATTRDGQWVVRFEVNGMTFSRLPPYTDWEAFSGEARRFAGSFLELTQARSVDRAALRYVNHFRLPHPGDIGEYFVGLPSYPAPLPQFVSNLLYRVTLHDPDRDFTAHVTHAVLDDLDPERMGFLLDVDAFRTADLPSGVDQLWETFDALRDFKNEIFFALITEQIAEMHE